MSRISQSPQRALTSPFVFAVCQAGAEWALKAELARNHPELRLAFSRPGFLTFKSVQGEFSPDVELKAIFARAHGLGLGKPAQSVAEVLERARDLALQLGGGPLCLHVFARETHPAGEEPDGYDPQAPARARREELLEMAREVAPALFRESVEALAGELVLDVVVVDDHGFWMGVHRHGPGHKMPWPGGLPPAVAPADAPSRVYLKVAHGLAWSGLAVKPGQTVLDIGAAPGGGTHAWLERGLRVVAVDPAEMDATLLQRHAQPMTQGPSRGLARLVHLSRPFEYLELSEIPGHVDWLAFDVNLNPRKTLTSLRKLAQRLQQPRPSGAPGGLKGVLLTLKLNTRESFEEIPWMLDKVRAMGLVDVRATQLPANRQEICVTGVVPTPSASRAPARPPKDRP